MLWKYHAKTMNEIHLHLNSGIIRIFPTLDLTATQFPHLV